MPMKPPQDFKQQLTSISLLYGKPLHETVFTLWWKALRWFPWSEVKAALAAHVVNPDKGQFMPTPADVVKILCGSTPSQALCAWTQVTEAIRNPGAYDSVIFADRLIHAVISDMGGWIALCRTPQRELPFRSQEFQTRYRAALIRPPIHCPRQLTGILEQQNRCAGYAPPDPVVLAPTPRGITQEGFL